MQESDSESSDDSLTEQLNQIGRLNLNLHGLSLSSYLPQYLTKNFDLPSLNIELPYFDYRKLHEFSSEISRYVGRYVNDAQQSSVKTIISSRLQMTNILNDLNLGISLSSAIDRLQPLKDVIHETMMLPVEDDVNDNGTEPFTEPQGIERVVLQQNIPVINELVIPEEDLQDNQRLHVNAVTGKKRKRSRKRSLESSRVSSELDIEELSEHEARELTSLQSLDDFYKQDLMRHKIQKIQRLDNLSQLLKNKLVTRLMMGNYYKYVNEKLSDGNQLKVLGELRIPLLLEEDLSDVSDKSPLKLVDDSTNASIIDGSDNGDINGDDIEMSDEEVILTDKDKELSYHNKSKDILGCTHYQRNCKIECPTCLKWFPCRFCHDQEITDHKLTRNEVKHVLCMFCTTPQEPNHYCVECDKELANYVCLKCKLYDNDYNKDIYHCDDCGICRLGLGLGKDYFHCSTCNICLSIDLRDSHKCLNNTTHCNCPICNEYLFTSVTKVVFMGCGHLIHESCYKELTQHSYKCPICKKTIVNMDAQFRVLDLEIIEQPLPLPYKLWRCIISCNDCKGKSNVLYHLLGLKCKYCHSYNTNQLKLIKPEEEPEDEIKPQDSVDRMTLIQTSLSDNFVIDNDYDGDYNKSFTEGDFLDSSETVDENSDQDKDESRDLVNIKRFTNRLINKPENNEVSYLTSIFQKYINQALKSEKEGS